MLKDSVNFRIEGAGAILRDCYADTGLTQTVLDEVSGVCRGVCLAPEGRVESLAKLPRF